VLDFGTAKEIADALTCAAVSLVDDATIRRPEIAVEDEVLVARHFAVAAKNERARIEVECGAIRGAGIPPEADEDPAEARCLSSERDVALARERYGLSSGAPGELLVNGNGLSIGTGLCRAGVRACLLACSALGLCCHLLAKRSSSSRGPRCRPARLRYEPTFVIPPGGMITCSPRSFTAPLRQAMTTRSGKDRKARVGISRRICHGWESKRADLIARYRRLEDIRHGLIDPSALASQGYVLSPLREAGKSIDHSVFDAGHDYCPGFSAIGSQPGGVPDQAVMRFLCAVGEAERCDPSCDGCARDDHAHGA
jgi:hypothetical protein